MTLLKAIVRPDKADSVTDIGIHAGKHGLMIQNVGEFRVEVEQDSSASAK